MRKKGRDWCSSVRAMGFQSWVVIIMAVRSKMRGGWELLPVEQLGLNGLSPRSTFRLSPTIRSAVATGNLWSGPMKSRITYEFPWQPIGSSGWDWRWTRASGDDSAEILCQPFLQEAIVSSSGICRDVHSLMLSIQHFLWRPLCRNPPRCPENVFGEAVVKVLGLGFLWSVRQEGFIH